MADGERAGARPVKTPAVQVCRPPPRVAQCHWHVRSCARPPWRARIPAPAHRRALSADRRRELTNDALLGQLQNSTVADARHLLRTTMKDVDGKQEELRELVSVRYRDFIDAADTISAMGNSARTIIGATRHTACNPTATARGGEIGEAAAGVGGAGVPCWRGGLSNAAHARTHALTHTRTWQIACA
jgi:hypothetical protein